MTKSILVSLDNKGKIRVVEVSYDWSDEQRGYVINRTTYQYGGKRTEQPAIWIYNGKAKRTVAEQVKLEYSSHIKKYLDKGYKQLPSDMDIEDKVAVTAFVQENLSNGVTDSNGFKKHMLAKPADKVATSVYDKLKYWLASRKIDGVRCSFYLKNGEVVSATRGGGNFDASTEHIRIHPTMINLFKNHPDLVLDGELYKHGKSLQQISGAARQVKDGSKSSWLQYYIYDVMDGSSEFEDRMDILDIIKCELSLGEFNPNIEYTEGDLQVQVVPHEKVVGWQNIQKLHNQYVEEGFEGVVIRDPNKVYNFGGRTNAMIKIKMYQDDEFEIVGYSEGLRPEDMVFICKVNNDLTFEAKPMGPRDLKYEYLDRMDEIIGKMATVKFFYYSDEGKPLQPSLKCIRDYE